MKIKRSKFFAVNNDIQKLSFWILLTEKIIHEKNYKIKDL